MGCKTCGGTMVGDGYTLVRHCETVDVSGDCYEPDAGPIYCKTEGPESTEKNRVWHSGPPPHAGWWQASANWNTKVWRWWNGARWSLPLRAGDCAEEIAFACKNETPTQRIEWNDYWPADARVPRLAPEDFEIGARWVCVKPLFETDFVGMELQVSALTAYTLELEGPVSQLVVSLSVLPDGLYVPRRCVGPQTRWDFPVAKGGRCG